ncbi:tRNA (adenosine(37)-N6)-threonylcarbamoyltransferase complex dimerization subunit type 1 TsaB [Carnimonas bestiolae]|uniref:tRNA (adenosine(37)-N6)-threonylcarbamoyltransferase complex dimerization subunit type 1 TsaB n=1 Tax=Carnimonas bestiolae TaxID=3402172 RepID=UPI003EDC8B83
MNMRPLRVLALDASSSACSVALWQGQPGSAGTLSGLYEVAPRQHMRKLLPMVDTVLSQAGIALADVDALAYGVGPGSFTGLRIAAGTAQGLAFGADKPMIGISTLAALALQACREGEGGQVCAALDARMDEIYVGCFAVERNEGIPQVTALDQEQVIAPQQLTLPAGTLRAIGAGFGYLERMPEQTRQQLVLHTSDAEPDAREIAQLAALELVAQRLHSPADVQPVYLRNNVAHRSTRGPLD